MKDEAKKTTLYWIRGDKERGNEVIKMLTDRGISNSHNMSGEDNTKIYCEDYWGKITCISTYSILSQFIKTFGEELTLPPKKEVTLADLAKRIEELENRLNDK